MKFDWTKVDWDLTSEEIQARYHISYSAIYKHCKKNNLPMPRSGKKIGRPKSDKTPEQPYERAKYPHKVPADADLTGSATELANLYNVNRATILRERKQRGIKADPARSTRKDTLHLHAELGAKIRVFARARGITPLQAAEQLIFAGLQALVFNLPISAD